MVLETLLASKGLALYKNLLLYIREKTEAVGMGKQISISDTVDVARHIMEDFNSSARLLEAAMGYYDPLDFVVSHAANVAIYSLKMATDMGLSEEGVENAVIAGILHDIGFSRVPVFSKEEEDLLIYEEQPDKALSEDDLRLVTEHPRYGHDAIVHDDARSERVAEIILQHHEKADGSGYPNGLMESEQHVQARIISIIDTFEALIHPRPFRDALVPPMGIEAIKSQVKGAYSIEMIKALLSSFSVYPVGHFVGLSDGSIARVVETYRDNPLRPIVELILDSGGNKLDPPMRINLKENQMISIKECLPRFRN